MESIHRLSDLTAAHVDEDKRHAALVTAIAQHRKMLSNPELLDMFLQSAPPSIAWHVKAAVGALDVSSGLASTRPMVQALLAAVDRQSVLGQLGAVRVPSTNTVGAAAAGAASAFWVGESSAKPVSTLQFAALSLPPRKVASQVALADELMRLGMNSLNLTERAITSAAASAIDSAFLDPANAGTAGVKPASVTNGLTTIPPLLDFQNQVGQVLAGISGGAPTRPVLVVSLQSALRLSALPGIRDFVKVIVSPAASNKLIAIDADGVAFTDDGGDLKIGQPDIEMNDAPANPTASGTVLVSSWQRNITVAKLERWVNWAKRADAVAYLTLA